MDIKLRNMAVFYIQQNNKMLMLYRIGSRVAPVSWCGIGGHFENAELNNAKACMLRELEEEMHLTENDLQDISLRYITLRFKNNEIRQNYFFFANLKKDVSVKLECDEGIPEWIYFDKLPGLEMPFSAKFVIEHYLNFGRYTDSLYGGFAEKDNVVFTELKEF